MSSRLNFRIDWWLIIPSLLLFALGFTLLITTVPELGRVQLFYFLISAVAFLVISRLDLAVPVSLSRVIYLASLAFLCLPYFFGIASRGSHRWLQFGQVSIQPSELVKPLLVLVFSGLAASSIRYKYVWLILAVTPPVLLIFFQPDLGTSLVLLVGWSTIFLSRVSLKHLSLASLAIVLLVIPVYQFVLLDYQQNRLVTFLNPYADPLGKGYHVIQSVISIGSGQLFGRGLGRGTQSSLRFLPEYHTDFIFASLGETFGFVGSVFTLSLFALMLWRIYRVSQTATNAASSLFCVSTTALFAFQIFVNIGMNLSLLPITGITLPVLSYGGSSLLSTAIALGLVNSISTSQKASMAV